MQQLSFHFPTDAEVLASIARTEPVARPTARVTEARGVYRGSVDIRIEGTDREAVDAAVADYEQSYGWGYGTRFSSTDWNETAGLWVARGSRSNSCD